MSEFLSDIPNATEVIGISIVVGILLIASFIQKVEKFAVLALVILIIYAVYLYYTGNEPSENIKEKLEQL